jgi:hypothetical protein
VHDAVLAEVKRGVDTKATVTVRSAEWGDKELTRKLIRHARLD